MRVLDALCQPSVLAAAYARLGKRPGLWAEDVPMRKIRQSPIEAMLQLQADLASGRYRAGRPSPLMIAKADGGTRELAVYPLRDRVAQRALLDVVQPLSESRFLPCSYGFRPGRGVHHAVRAARSLLNQGFDWLVDADIRQCFDQIPRRRLLDAVGGWLDDAQAPGLVCACLGWQEADLVPGARGIPQGACLSPWLCNVYLHAFDQASCAAEVPLVRYADDFLLFAEARTAASVWMRRGARWLADLGLQLHPLKSRVTRAFQSVRFLGHDLGVQSC